MNNDTVNMSTKHVEETQENKHMNDDAKTAQTDSKLAAADIKKRLHHAGYTNSCDIVLDVGLLIYERDAANQDVNHLKGEIDKLVDVDRIREIDQKDDEIEELKANIEWMKRNERNWKEEWKAEVAMLKCKIDLIRNDNELLLSANAEVARIAMERDAISRQRSMDIDCLTRNHEAELASVLTAFYRHTIREWNTPITFMCRQDIGGIFRWDGSKFIPISAESSQSGGLGARAATTEKSAIESHSTGSAETVIKPGDSAVIDGTRFVNKGSSNVHIGEPEPAEFRNMTKEENDALTEFTYSELKDPMDKPVTVGMMVKILRSNMYHSLASDIEKEAGL